MKQTLTIPGRLPGLNEIVDAARGNKFKAAKQKREYTALVEACCLIKQIRPVNSARFRITFYEENRRRDKDNIQAGVKFIFDGCVAAGVIKNDGWNEVLGIEPFFEVDKINPRVEVVIISGGDDNEN